VDAGRAMLSIGKSMVYGRICEGVHA